MLWAVLLIFLVCMIMSVFTVEIIGPETRKLWKSGDLHCDRCEMAFDGIYVATYESPWGTSWKSHCESP